MITKNKVVAVSYELKTEPDGDILKRPEPTNHWSLFADKGRPWNILK